MRATHAELKTEKKMSRKPTEAENIDPVAGKTAAEVLGEIVWLMTQDSRARELPVKDVERLIMPAILLRQFHIEYARAPIGKTVSGEAVFPPENSEQTLQPVSVEIFAMCSDAVVAALESNAEIALSLSDFRSGNIRKTLIQIGRAKQARSA